MRQSGFTLLELSIVLVIIGLIIGGVTVGSSLIEQAQLQSVGKDFQKYETAVRTFQLKYRALPGDMPNAYAYWPSAGMNGTSCRSATGLNGDGDGFIEDAAPVNEWEDAKAWVHLVQAALISGNYNGKWFKTIGTTNGTVPGINIPPGPVDGSGFYLASTISNNGACSQLGNNPVYGRSGNFITFGRPGDRSDDPNSFLTGSVLSPQDGKALDTKTDDGKMQSGKLIARDGQNATCGSGGDYDLTRATDACRFIYWLN